MVNPSDIFTIRKTGQGTLTVSIPPDRLEEVAEAMVVLTTGSRSVQGKSQAAIDAIVEQAKRVLREDSKLRDFLADELQVLLHEPNAD